MIVDSWNLGASLQDAPASIESVTHDCADLSWATKARAYSPQDKCSNRNAAYLVPLDFTSVECEEELDGPTTARRASLVCFLKRQRIQNGVAADAKGDFHILALQTL
jgi:hypothetical protein